MGGFPDLSRLPWEPQRTLALSRQSRPIQCPPQRAGLPIGQIDTELFLLLSMFKQGRKQLALADRTPVTPARLSQSLGCWQ